MFRSPSLPSHPRVAFSLMELLVVIAVTAILLLLSLVGMRLVRERLQETRSVTNLRLMAPALIGYVNDHAGRLPEGAFSPTLNGVKVKYWFNALDYYMGGDDYLPTGMAKGERPAWQNCPAKVFRKPVLYYNGGVGVGYGWNHSFFGYTQSWYPEKLGWGSRMSEVELPARTIIIGTSEDNPDATDVARHVVVYPSATGASRRFHGRGLYLFLDGHVEALTPTEAIDGQQYLFKKKKS